jgi:hypothetical protein
MKTKKVKISEIKANPENPRVIRDDKFKQLVNSIKKFPKMLEVRPIAVNSDMVVLGGNMRLKACQDAGMKEVTIVVLDNFNEQEQKEFIIKDNVAFGEWDYELLANEWDVEKLDDWGLNVPVFGTDEPIDYSILEGADVSDQMTDMAGNVKKAIQIEFEPDHYEEAQELVKFWREQKMYIGYFLIQKLKEEQMKL